MKKQYFGSITVELGAGWIADGSGTESNPAWVLVVEPGLRTCFSYYNNARYNIYDRTGKIFPCAVAADAYKKAVYSTIQKLHTNQENLFTAYMLDDPHISTTTDFMLHDFKVAEVKPISTFVDFREFSANFWNGSFSIINLRVCNFGSLKISGHF
ncbi:hypothetical protein L1987_20858 [Smallanthus sonchifolius]|uniref:Uncharacterized protein n=1 Tax=Smallanthus sonchifolius TaxID=185202 RepID=A0ACB9IUN8_9ASTR|nr:hypothetical protein L1987_20858 [Smallanthus sonchifolius]